MLVQTKRGIEFRLKNLAESGERYHCLACTFIPLTLLFVAYRKKQKFKMKIKSASRCIRQILEALHAEWRNSTPRFSSAPERRNGNIM